MENKLTTENKFTYLETGQGKHLIILHGLMGSLSNFGGVVDYFSKKYCVLLPELPIYTLPLLKTNIKNLALYIKDFIAHKNLEKVFLLGNSLGGHVALYLAKHFGELIEGMILTGSSGLYEKSLGSSYPKRGNKTYIREKSKDIFYDPDFVSDELVDSLYETFKNREAVLRIVFLAKSAIRHNMAKDLPNMNMPVCLVWGKQDIITPPHVAEDFQRLLPNSELHWIDKCGHAPMMEHPKQFNTIVAHWLEKILKS